MPKYVDTKEWIPDKSYAYVVYKENGKTAEYFTSKDNYELWHTNNEYRTKVIEFIRDLLGYKPKMKLPTLMFKSISEYEESVGLDVLYDTLVNCQDSIMWAFDNKQFTGDIARVQYLFAIVQNHYGDVWREKVARKREEAAMAKITNDPNLNCYGNDEERKITTKNISQFLDEDDE